MVSGIKVVRQRHRAAQVSFPRFLDMTSTESEKLWCQLRAATCSDSGCFNNNVYLHPVASNADHIDYAALWIC